MAVIVANEYYKELLKTKQEIRDYEADSKALNSTAADRICRFYGLGSLLEQWIRCLNLSAEPNTRPVKRYCNLFLRLSLYEDKQAYRNP